MKETHVKVTDDTELLVWRSQNGLSRSNFYVQSSLWFKGSVFTKKENILADSSCVEVIGMWADMKVKNDLNKHWLLGWKQWQTVIDRG